MSVPKLKRERNSERERKRERARTMWPAAGEPGRHEAVGLVACSAVRLRLRLRGSGPRLGAAQEPKRFRALRWQHPRSIKTRTVRASDVCVPRLCVCVCVQNCLCVCAPCEVLKIDCTLKTHKTQNKMSKGKAKASEEAKQSVWQKIKAKWNVNFVPQIRIAEAIFI